MVGIKRARWPLRPGETPHDDLSGLLLRLPAPTRSDVSFAEAKNIMQAEKYYLRGRNSQNKFSFDVTWARDLHRRMFGEVWSWAGEFRQTNTSIGVDKYQIQLQLLQLFSDLNAWPAIQMPLLEQSVHLHHRAVLIHPFHNGNGRWARFLTNLWLYKNKSAFIRWPVTVDETSPVREEYITALQAADRTDMAPLLALHAKFQGK